MFKVLLVSADISVLETLLNTIAWRQFGVDNILTAKNGIHAWEQIRYQHIDLLIMDINIPNGNGMGLLKEVRDHYPSTKYIIISDYREFEYVRQAIRLGSEGYLLKPLSEGEMEDTINRAFDNILSDGEGAWQILRDTIIKFWLKNSISMEEMSENCDLLDINIHQPGYCAICIQWNYQEGCRQLFQDTCIRKFDVMQYDVYSTWDQYGYYTFIIGGRLHSQEHLARLFSETAKETGCLDAITLTVGCVVTKCQDLFLSHESAVKIYKSAEMLPKNVMLSASKINLSKTDLWVIQELRLLFGCRNEKERKIEFCSFAKKFLAAQERENYNSVYTQLSRRLYLFMSKELMDQEQVCCFRYPDSMSDFSEREFLDSCVDLLEYGYSLYGCRFKELSPVVQSFIGYIHEHYAERVLLKEFCTVNKLRPPYIGYLFKKEIGVLFNNYLMQYRIYCSVPLLCNTPQKVSEIAVGVGFSSVNYFIACFKNELGISPNRYRSRR